jgi:hypothetical protein
MNTSLLFIAEPVISLMQSMKQRERQKERQKEKQKQQRASEVLSGRPIAESDRGVCSLNHLPIVTNS